MRNPTLITAVLLVAVGGCAESISNSPECERWIADYSHKLAESRPVQEIAHKVHAKPYVHRVIGTMASKPRLIRTSAPQDPLHPIISPKQMLKRFQVLCGDLPPVETAMALPPLAPPAPPVALLTPDALPGTPIGSAPVTPTAYPATPGSPIMPSGEGGFSGPLTPSGAIPATSVPSVTPPSGTKTPPNTPPGGGTTIPPTPPGGGNTTPPGGTTTPPGGGNTPQPPSPPELPPSTPPEGPPAPPVPEPSTLVLMLAGTVLAAGYAARRRFVTA